MVVDPFSDAKTIIDTICEKSGSAREDVLAAVEEKKAKFAGMLTDAGAALLAAKDMGVDLEMGKYSEKHTIAQLAPGMHNVDVSARVAQVFAPRTYEKNGRSGTMASLILADDTGEIRLTLWNRAAESFLRGEIGKGDTIIAQNCTVKEFRGQKQLESGVEGALSVVQAHVPAARKFAELGEGESGVDTVARVARVFETKTFSSNGREGKLCACELFDGESRMRLVGWNENANAVEQLEQNAAVCVENAYTKKGMNGTELHLGFAGRVRTARGEVNIPEVQERTAARTDFSSAREGIFENRAVVAAVLESVLVFDACPSCGKKVGSLEGKSVCERCGQVEDPQKRLVLSLELDDGFARAAATLFGSHAEHVLGQGAREVASLVDARGKEGALEELARTVVGREVVVSGTLGERGGAREMRVSRAVIADPVREVQKAIQG